MGDGITLTEKNANILPDSDVVNVGQFSNLFVHKDKSYKLFWFEAILKLVVDVHKETITYDEIIEQMVASAWYMVNDCHLSLGKTDALEGLCKLLFQKADGKLKTSEKYEKITNFYKTKRNDSDVSALRLTLIEMVPYRVQSPFLAFKDKDWCANKQRLMDKLNQQKHLIYYYDKFRNLETQIHIPPEWIEYFIENNKIISGWIEFNKIIYLQKKNPSVPGIPKKIHEKNERDYENVRKLWKAVLTVNPMKEIYAEKMLDGSTKISLDHFVPWSYVGHDEMWNLSPTLKKINSSKSNGLPNWNKYFVRFADIEYRMYHVALEREQIHKRLDRCFDTNMNDERIFNSLYCKDIDENMFRGQLEEVMRPVYEAAMKMGFGMWEMSEEEVKKYNLSNNRIYV